MDLSVLLSDDQIAVIGCFFALAVCGGLAALSFRFGPASRPERQAGRSSTPLPVSDADVRRSSDRRAA